MESLRKGLCSAKEGAVSAAEKTKKGMTGAAVKTREGVKLLGTKTIEGASTVASKTVTGVSSVSETVVSGVTAAAQKTMDSAASIAGGSGSVKKDPCKQTEDPSAVQNAAESPVDTGPAGVTQEQPDN